VQWQLSSGRRDTLAELVPVVCPPSVAEAWDPDTLIDEAERILASMSPQARGPVLVAIDVFGLSSRIGRRDPGRHFDAWWSSPVALRRGVAKVLKALILLPAFEHPAVTERLGYDPAAWVSERRAEWLREHADDARRHRELLLTPVPRGPR
jgi:hypothetical protein